MTETALAVTSTESTELIPEHLVAKAKEYATRSKAESTLRAYDSSWRAFTAWCRERNLQPLPASPAVVASYVAHLGETLRPQTVKRHMAGIAQAHKLAGVETPTQHEAVRLTLQGLIRMKGLTVQPKKALRIEHLKLMVGPPRSDRVEIRDSAILLLGFATGMRRSELVGLNVEDLSFEPEGIAIDIRKSKTDQQGRGRKVAVPLGHGEDTCPVRAVRQWIEAGQVETGPLFTRLDPASVPGQGLTGRSIALIIKKRATRAGLDPQVFAGHSLRRGFATEAVRAGASESDVARSTGHRSLATLRRYVEEGSLFNSCAARHLGL